MPKPYNSFPEHELHTHGYMQLCRPVSLPVALSIHQLGTLLPSHLFLTWVCTLHGTLPPGLLEWRWRFHWVPVGPGKYAAGSFPRWNPARSCTAPRQRNCRRSGSRGCRSRLFDIQLVASISAFKVSIIYNTILWSSPFIQYYIFYLSVTDVAILNIGKSLFLHCVSEDFGVNITVHILVINISTITVMIFSLLLMLFS